MTFYIGQKKAGEIFLGGKKVGRIYLGQTLVHMTAVVDKPTFLEYIETDGNSYIDTGYLPSENTYVEYNFEIISKPTGSFNGLFGSRLDTSRYPYNVFCKKYLQLRIDYGRYTETVYQCALNTKYIIRAGNNEFYINDELVKSYVVSYPGTSPYSMYLGNFNAAGTPYATGTAQKIYGWKVYENNVLSQDLRPALDPNGKVCMYDTVTKKYFYNAGTGELKAGGRFVESIYFDGASYVDTGLKHETCTIETAVKYEAGHSRRMLTGWSGVGSYWGMMSNSKLEVSGRGTRGTDLTDCTVVNIALDNENLLFTVTADGITKTVAAIYSNNTYTIGCTVPSSVNKIIGNVYYSKAHNASGELVQDLRPYVDGDGVACFKDVVTDTLFYNKGTGTLTYTE